MSFLVPIYNHYRFLDKCIRSILDNRNSQIELICINDNSPDQRVNAYLQTLEANEVNTKIINNHKNLGISIVLNQGVNISESKYIAFVDCDDYINPHAIHKLLTCIHKYPEVDYFFSDRFDIDENNNILRHAKYGGYPNILPSGNIKNDLLKGMVASHLKVIKKETIKYVGGFDDLLNGVQDWDLALKISQIGKFYYIKQPLYYHRIHTASVTNLEKSSQFRKTNIVRRKYYDIELNRKNLRKEDIRLNNRILKESTKNNRKYFSNNTVIFNPHKYSLEAIENEFTNGKTCIFDARFEYSLHWINFLREFNSFFDLIIINSPETAASIIGYVWNLDILNYNFK